MGILNMRGLVKQVRGVSYKPSDIHDSLDDDSITLLRANNINDGQINFDDVVFVDRKNVSKEQILRKGDVLICASSGSKNLVGKAASVCFEREATFGAFCKVVRPNCQEDAGYIGMYFQSESYRREISSVAIGANINNIRNEHIDSLCLNWPNTIERQQAVQVMTKVDSIIRLRKSELNQLDDLIKARFVEMFGRAEDRKYPTAKLGKYAKLQGGYAFKSKDFVVEGIPLVQIGNVNRDYLEWDVINTVPEEYLDRYKEYALSSNDLVMAMTRPIIKSLDSVKIAKVAESDLPCLLNQRVGRFQIIEKLHPIYLEMLCKTDDFKKYVERMSGNSLQPNISSKQVEDYIIILPPMDLQEQFATFVAQVDKSKFVVQKALDEAQLLFDSLMQQYFG